MPYIIHVFTYMSSLQKNCYNWGDKTRIMHRYTYVHLIDVINHKVCRKRDYMITK